MIHVDSGDPQSGDLDPMREDLVITLVRGRRRHSRAIFLSDVRTLASPRVLPDSGQPVPVGADGTKQYVAVHAIRGRRSSRMIQLGPTQPEMVELEALFFAAIPGLRMDEDEFSYQSGNQYLTLVNSTPASGMTVDPANSYVIPISYITRPSRGISNVHYEPRPLE